MPSTYTTNLGIEKIATGEQSGTWGSTTNTNLDLIDEAVNGVVQVTLASAGSSGSPNGLPITNGTSSDGRNRFIEFIDGGDLGGTAFVQLTPDDAEKIVHIRNSLSADRSITIFQGNYNASNDFVIPNGADVVLKFDGAGAGAVVSDVFINLTPTKVTAADAVIDTLTLGGTEVTASASELNTLDGFTGSTAELNTLDGFTGSVDDLNYAKDLRATGVTTTEFDKLDGLTPTTTELNYVDGVTSPIQTQLNTKAPIDNPSFTGTTTIPTADINGGTIDGTVIGGSTAASGSFTTGQFDTSLNVDGTVTADGLNVRSTSLITLTNENNVDSLNITEWAAGSDNAVRIQGHANPDFQAGSYSGIQFSSAVGYSGPLAGIAAKQRYGNGTELQFADALEFVIKGPNDADKWIRPLTIFSNGNISFYEDTGTTPKFFWDASAESLGIGTSSPSYKLDVYNNGSDIARFRGNALGLTRFIISNNIAAFNGRGVSIDCLAGNGDSIFSINSLHIGSTSNSVAHFNIEENDASTTYLSLDAAQLQVRILKNTVISGSLSKGSGSFKIDHPLKPDTHHLVHSFVEAPQADNIYRGKVDLVEGLAAINIDTVAGMTEGTFDSLNREVQCFTSNESGWTAVRGSVSGNILTIEAQDTACTDTVSWIVIGERKDQHMYDTEWTDENGKVIVEPEKLTEEELTEEPKE